MFYFLAAFFDLSQVGQDVRRACVWMGEGFAVVFVALISRRWKRPRFFI